MRFKSEEPKQLDEKTIPGTASEMSLLDLLDNYEVNSSLNIQSSDEGNT
jgi:hypothetical protein